MAQKLKFGNGNWATKEGSTLAYSDTNNAFKPLPFSFERNSIATRVNKEGLIEVVGNDVPRIDYTDSADGVLLLEPQRTNLFTYSENLTTNWTRSGINTPTDVSVIAPNGASSVKRLQTNNSDGSLAFSYNTNYNQVSGTTYTVSVYAKSNTNENQIFGLFGNGSGSSNNHSGDLIATSEWKRFTYTFTASNASTIGFCKGNDRLSFDILMWGFQVEIGSFETSYIPTNGSTVTREADVANGSGNSEVFNDSEGVLFVDIAANADYSYERFLSLSDGSTSNRISLWYYSATNGLAVAVYSSGVTQFFTTTILPKDTLSNKISVKYKQNDFSLWINGFEVATDTSGNAPIGLSELSFDRGDSALDFYGKTKEIGYYDTALTDAELEYMTSYRSLNELVTELNLNTL